MLKEEFLDVPLRERRDARGQERPREADDGMHCERRESDSLGVASAGWRENVGVNWRVCWKLRLRFGRLVVRVAWR